MAHFSICSKGPDEIGAMPGQMMQNTAATLVVAPGGDPMEGESLVAVPVRFTVSKSNKNMDSFGGNRISIVEGTLRKLITCYGYRHVL